MTKKFQPSPNCCLKVGGSTNSRETWRHTSPTKSCARKFPIKSHASTKSFCRRQKFSDCRSLTSRVRNLKQVCPSRRAALKAAEQLVSSATFSQVKSYRIAEIRRQKLNRSVKVGWIFCLNASRKFSATTEHGNDI